MHRLRNLALALVAAALVAALVFLYDKTQAVDLRDQNEVLAQLRELKEIDSRWDIDVLRERLEFGTQALPAINRGAAADKALQALDEVARRTSSPALSAGLPELSKAIVQKAALVANFTSENRNTKMALQELLAWTGSLQSLAADNKRRYPSLGPVLARLTGAAPQYYWLAQEAHRVGTEAAMVELEAAAKKMPETLGEHAARVRRSGEALLKSKPLEQAAFGKLLFLTSGPRLDTLAFSFGRELEATLQDKERFRIYLISYAGALLIVLAYLGSRLKAANVSLAQANAGLEQRVRERTRELSEALAHLKESEAQLIQSEKMSSLGQMVAGVAHEINTPLAYTKASLHTVEAKLPDIASGIAGCEKLLELLRAGASAHAGELNRQFAASWAHLARLKQQHVMEELKGRVKDGLYGTDQVAEIVGNLRDFSRLDRSRVTSFNLNDGLASTLTLAKHLLKTVTVDKQLSDIPAVTCSPSQVNQVFLNLVTNAVQAMEGGHGKLTLTTRREGDGVAVDIADNGKGIAPEVLPKIFDPFFSTKEIGKGTGLGLSISYTIVRQHGGRIDVESQPDVGTKFTVWLPLKPPAEAELPV